MVSASVAIRTASSAATANRSVLATAIAMPSVDPVEEHPRRDAEEQPRQEGDGGETRDERRVAGQGGRDQRDRGAADAVGQVAGDRGGPQAVETRAQGSCASARDPGTGRRSSRRSCLHQRERVELDLHARAVRPSRRPAHCLLRARLAVRRTRAEARRAVRGVSSRCAVERVLDSIQSSPKASRPRRRNAESRRSLFCCHSREISSFASRPAGVSSVSGEPIVTPPGAIRHQRSRPEPRSVSSHDDAVLGELAQVVAGRAARLPQPLREAAGRRGPEVGELVHDLRRAAGARARAVPPCRGRHPCGCGGSVAGCSSFVIACKT